jgi:hypothetical protein
MGQFMKIFLDEFVVYSDMDTHVQAKVMLLQMQGVWYQHEL